MQEPAEIAGDIITPTGKKTNYLSIFTSGFIINTLNPGVISFWVLMAASLSSVYSMDSRIIIFSTCLAMNILADSGKVLGAGAIRHKLSDKNILLINRLSGLLYLCFGGILLTGIIYSLMK